MSLRFLRSMLAVVAALASFASLSPAVAFSAESSAAEDGAPVRTGPREHLAAAIDAYAMAQSQSDRDLRIEGFRRAQLLFEKAGSQGAHSAALLTNTGNAALQADRLGHAILAYRRALLTQPGHPQARDNLAYARALLPAWVPAPSEGGVLDTFFFWHRTLPSSSRSSLAALCFLISGAVAAGAVLRRSGTLAVISILPAIVWLALLASLSFDPSRTAERQAVVVGTEVAAYASDSFNSPTLFGAALPAGAEFEILDDRGEWIQLRLFNGRTAWVQAAHVARITDSD